MASTRQRGRAATGKDIREIVGALDDGAVARIVAVGATRDEVIEAQTWITSDDYLHRRLHHDLAGRAARVFAILEAELPEPDRS